jgi:hypothetical protein
VGESRALTKHVVSLSVAWEGDPPAEGDQTFEQASAYAAILARTLESAGYQPRRLEIGLRRGTTGALELRVSGEVPGMTEADFISLARVTLTGTRLRHGLAGEADIELVASLGMAGVESNGLRPGMQLAAPAARRALPLGRIAAGVALGLLLGVVGLPRLELPLPKLWLPDASAPRATLIVLPTASPQTIVTLRDLEPSPVPQTPIRMSPLAPTPAPSRPGVVLAHRFVAPLADWPNDPYANTWFADGAYRLFARQPGRFVAVSVPLQESVGDAVLSAQFRKTGGPPGGGYGFIVRAQGVISDRDSPGQTGRYLVLEVGDKGDIGIWQREQTRWIDIVPWTHTDAVREGFEPNTLTVSTRGPALRFEVNDQVVAAITYNGLPPTGGVGIFVGGDLNNVALDWLRIETL